jgi:hypothetical protein
LTAAAKRQSAATVEFDFITQSPGRCDQQAVLSSVPQSQAEAQKTISQLAWKRRPHSIAATFLLDPYYLTHAVTNDAPIQPHRSEYLRSLPTLKGFNRDLPPTSKFTGLSTESPPWVCHLRSLLLTGENLKTRHDDRHIK